MSEEEVVKKSRGFDKKVNTLSRENAGGELFHDLEVHHDDAERNCYCAGSGVAVRAPAALES